MINQEAQAKYYDKQTDNLGNFWIIYASPITTVVGVLIAILTLTLQNRNARKLEAEKWEETRKDDLEKWNRTRKDDLGKWYQTKRDENDRNARLAAADLLKNIAIAAHSMTWALWVADNDVEHFNIKLVRKHDELMKNLYADLVASQAILASYDKNLYQKTRRMVNSIYSYDEQFANAAKVIDEAERGSDFSSYAKKVKNLGKLWKQLYEFSQYLPNEFGDMFAVKSDSQNQEDKKQNE
ncbi:MAG: hypothetical protein WA584_23210 [Pyrinomonadaceae bacterium]